MTDWLPKLFNTLKIPLKILLPATCLFSGILTLAPDELLIKLKLFEWESDNGFIIGLIFSISACLILIYALYFVRKRIYRLTMDRRTMNRMFQLNHEQLSIIIMLYNSYGYKATLNYGDPQVQVLLSGNYIYCGEQMVSADDLNNEINAKFILQPFVYHALNHYKQKFKKHIQKMENKITKEKDISKKEHLSNKLTNAKNNYEVIYNRGQTIWIDSK